MSSNNHQKKRNVLAYLRASTNKQYLKISTSKSTSIFSRDLSEVEIKAGVEIEYFYYWEYLPIAYRYQ